MPLLALPLSSGAYGTASNMPDLYLEWSPTTNPGAPPSWERIPLADIRAIDINRGRNRELDQYQAGRMTVVLDNRDRHYDPQYSAGPNFGNVKPMKRIRLRAVWDTTYDLFTGFVDSWDQDYDMTKEAVCVVTATDAFKVLGGTELPVSVWFQEVSADDPTHWFRFTTPVSGDNVPDLMSATVVGQPADWDALSNPNGASPPTLGATSLIYGDSDGAITFDNAIVNQSVYVTSTSPIGVTTANDFTIEFIVQIGASGTTQNLYMQPYPSTGNHSVIIRYVSTGVTRFIISDGTTTATADTTGISLANNVAHHVACTFTSADGRMRIYVDGTEYTSGSTTYAGTTIPRDAYFDIGGSASFGGPEGVMDDFVIYNGQALSAARITAHSEARVAPWNGDTTGERIGRLLDAIGWPANERDIDTGDSTLQSAEITGQSALDHAQLVRNTEYGELFMAANGNVRFISRSGKWKPPYNEPTFTLSDDGSDLGYGKLKFNYDDQLIRNKVTVGYDNGLTFVVNSTSSQDSYLVKSYTLTGLIGDQDETEGRDYASYVLARYDDALLRVEGISVTPQRNPTTYFPEVLAADLVYQVNVERTPQAVGSAIDTDYTIEGISHHIEPKFWRTDLQLSPADLPGAFILDSTSQGVLDTHVLGF